MKLTARNIHRDVAYFYLGLIIAFSISGIFLNHRQWWHPMDYTYKVENIELQLPKNKDDITKEFLVEESKKWNLQDKFRGFRIRDGKLNVGFKDSDLRVDLETGKGERSYSMRTPLLGQMTVLHVDTSTAWIWYSDIFGIGMIVIALTGMFIIKKGKTSFWQRGWKLALLGVIFPLVFLFLLS